MLETATTSFRMSPAVRAVEGDRAVRVLVQTPQVQAPPSTHHGRWMWLQLGPPEAAGSVRARVAHHRKRWPDLVVPLQQTSAGAEAWIFLGEHVAELSLEGPASWVERLEWRGSRVVDDLPAGVRAALCARTAAELQRQGVHAVYDIAFSDDPDWPLVATGPDPQLRFARLDTGRQLMVRVHIDTEDGQPARPSAYWAAHKSGYRAQACLPLAPSPDGTWHATLPPLRPGTRWRLDPMARSGRFRISQLEISTPERTPPWERAYGRAVAWLDRARLRRGPGSLVPTSDLKPLDRRRQHYLATGDDPRFHVRTPLAPGFYMLEVVLETPRAPRVRARLYADSGDGESEAQAWSLPVRRGRLTKRLLWLEARSSLRFDPMTMPGELSVRHFAVRRVTRGFAVSRIRRKLHAAGLPAPEARSAADLDALWQRYCNLFEANTDGGITYPEWLELEAATLPSVAQQRADIERFAWRPLISIVTPTYNTPPRALRACIESVLGQSYPHWQWCIADDASTDPEVEHSLRDLAAREPRVRLTLREHNGHIVAATRSALALAAGEFVALLDHDDELAPHALYYVARALQTRPGAQLVYSDEDKLDAHGERCEPFFKPDFSPDLLLSQNYISHLGVYRRSLVEAAGGFREGFEGSQDYDLALRCAARIEDPRDVLHVPKVLYHWRKEADSAATDSEHKPYATAAARRALEECARETGSGATVSVLAPGLYRHRWPLPDPPPLVSLIVPTRDGLQVLMSCIESILERTRYPHFELLVVDNQSTCPDTIAYLEDLPARSGQRARVLRYDAPFNFSALNNFAARQARGSVLGLVNNDVEVIEGGWLAEMVAHALRPDIGCVGAKLYYPDGSIQHAGVVLGIGGVAGHSHKYFTATADGYFSRLRIVHNVSAVTAATLLVERHLFEQVGGMDERLAVAFNDVDLCLKVQVAGYRNLWTPFAELYHHESKSRGLDIAPEQQPRFAAECALMRERWGSLLERDPYYNPNLTLEREDYSLGLPRRR